MSRPIVGAGTPEQAWRDWSGLAAAAPLDLAGVRRVLVVAPHPDDEVLGAGGTIALLHDAGADVAVLALTDGEASHPGATVDSVELGRRRAAESREALRRLLGSAPVLDRLGLPDGGVAGHEEAIAGAVAARIGAGDWCLVPYHDDGHPDHEAAARAASAAAVQVGARVVEYPIWLWHWSEPGEGCVRWHRVRRVELPEGVRSRKRDAVGAFQSQLEPLGPEAGAAAILPPAILQRFERRWEVLFA